MCYTLSVRTEIKKDRKMKYDNNYWKANWTTKPRYPMFVVKRTLHMKTNEVLKMRKYIDTIIDYEIAILFVLAYLTLL